MIGFLGIDGTSTETDTYGVTYANSFVNRLHRNELVKFTQTKYLRGPFLDGRHTAESARQGYDWVRDRWRSGLFKALFLCGHSRGGAAVVEVCKWLRDDNIPVECLILFDAVDRSHTVGGVFQNTPIASNVRKAIHARRDVLRSCSRLSFGNCGLTRDDERTAYFSEKFFCTHSAVGGVPWPRAVLPGTEIPNPTGLIWEPGELKSTHVTPVAEKQGSIDTWRWASAHIATAYHFCQQRLREGTRPPVGVQPPVRGPVAPVKPRPAPGGGTGGGNGAGQYYVVQSGDWLSKIALQFYGDAMKYDLIHQANLSVIGPDPDVIEPGQRLRIPAA